MSPSPTVTLRPLAAADLPMLLRWLHAGHVREWWPGEPATLAAVGAKYLPRIAGEDVTHNFIAEEDGIPFGMIQCYRHADDPDWDRAVGIPAAAGTDYLIGEPSRLGHGLGAAMIRAVTAIAFDLYPEVDTMVAIPQRANRASCRALEKAGFTLRYQATLDSDDPSDSGVSSVYALDRPARP